MAKRTGYWLKDPRKAREGETIGGGYFVFRRGDGTNRVRPSNWPFEYATPEAAYAQAEKLAQANPGFTFEVFERRSSLRVTIVEADPAQSEAA